MKKKNQVTHNPTVGKSDALHSQWTKMTSCTINVVFTKIAAGTRKLERIENDVHITKTKKKQRTDGADDFHREWPPNTKIKIKCLSTTTLKLKHENFTKLCGTENMTLTFY
jgi:hypothetical protein